MNRDALMGLFRHALTTAGGALASYGMVDASQVEIAVGAIVALAGVILSVIDKRKR